MGLWGYLGLLSSLGLVGYKTQGPRIRGSKGSSEEQKQRGPEAKGFCEGQKSYAPTE